MNKIELLAPAGNLDKLNTALYFGADAVYCGGKAFSLRSFADNFTAEDFKQGVTIAHSMGKKIYVTINIFARNYDFEHLKDYLKMLDQHKKTGAACTVATITVPMEEASRFGICNTTPDGTIYEF